MAKQSHPLRFSPCFWQGCDELGPSPHVQWPGENMTSESAFAERSPESVPTTGTMGASRGVHRWPPATTATGSGDQEPSLRAPSTRGSARSSLPCTGRPKKARRRLRARRARLRGIRPRGDRPRPVRDCRSSSGDGQQQPCAISGVAHRKHDLELIAAAVAQSGTGIGQSFPGGIVTESPRDPTGESCRGPRSAPCFSGPAR